MGPVLDLLDRASPAMLVGAGLVLGILALLLPYLRERRQRRTAERLAADAGRRLRAVADEMRDAAAAHDASLRDAAEARRRDAELAEGVLDAQRAIAGAALDGEATLQAVADRSLALTGAAWTRIDVRSNGEPLARARAGAEPTPADRIRLSLAGIALVQPAEAGHDLARACFETGQLQYADDRSAVALPIAHGGATIGALVVAGTAPNAFGERELRGLELLAGLAGVVLGHALALEARQQRLEERTRALQESEQRFKQLVDAAQEGIWVFDDHGVTTYVNRRMATLLATQPGEILGRAIFDFTDSATRVQLQRQLAESGSNGGLARDLRLRRRDGRDLWAILATSPIVGRDGSLVGVVATVTDITERKLAEDRLRRSADRLRLLHEVDHAVLAARSFPELGRAALLGLQRMVPCQRCTIVRYDFDRDEARIIAGFDRGQPLSAAPMPLSRFSPRETLRLGVVRSIDDLAALTPRPPILDEVLADGSRSVLSVPLLVDGEAIGELNLTSAATHAFTPEHRDIAIELATPLALALQQAGLRDALQRQAADLEQRVAERTAEVQRLGSELETLTATLAHDLRAPIRQLAGYCELLVAEHGPRLDATARHYAERIRDGAERAEAIADGLLQLARIGRQDLMRRPVPLRQLVHEVRRGLEPLAEGRLVEWQIGELPMLDCDPALIGLALTQLLDNALKFTRPRARAVIRVTCAQADNQLGVAVADNGVGFDPALAGRLFAPFQRLGQHEAFEGLGLGLALVQRIVARHGGRLWADAEPDGGATVGFTIDVGEAGESHEARESPQPSAIQAPESPKSP